jgi:hypothetical protein
VDVRPPFSGFYQLFRDLLTQFIVQGIDGSQAFFLLTTNGEIYLVLNGNGDLNLLAKISHTVRPIQ